MPKVSVIVPVYNVEPYLRQCLDSIINQTLKDIEIIIIADTESTDKSLDICYEYEKLDSRIKVILQGHDGLGTARNYAMQFVTGMYVGFIDSDDFVSLNFFEKLYLEASRMDADISAGNMKRFQNGKIISPTYNANLSPYIKNNKLSAFGKIVLPAIFTGVWYKIYKKEFLTNHNIFCAERLLAEDIPFTYLCSLYSPKIVCVPDVYYYYRINQESLTNIDNKNRRGFQIFDVFDKCKNERLKRLSEIDEQESQNILDNIIIIKGSWMLNNISKTMSKEFFESLKSEFTKIEQASHLINMSKCRYKAVLKSKSVYMFKIKYALFYFLLKALKLDLN